jgi:hypothetical protein
MEMKRFKSSYPLEIVDIYSSTVIHSSTCAFIDVTFAETAIVRRCVRLLDSLSAK